MSHLNSHQVQEIKSRLEELEKELEADALAAKKSSAPVKLDQQAVGRVSRIDAIQQQQMNAAALDRIEKRLSMVQATKNKIDSELFGLCRSCEEEISFERLKVRPESALCVNCAKKK